MSTKKPKMSRKERERQMIAEMDSAMLEQKFPGAKSGESTDTEPAETDKNAVRQKEQPSAKSGNGQKKDAAQKLHCPRCKSLMENGKCPHCGHYIYVPMDKEKRNKIRLIVGGVCVVGFVILFVVLQMKK